MLRMPAEWQKHGATWLAWPYDPITFPDRVEKAEKVFEQIMEALAPGERVNLIVRDKKRHPHKLENVRMWGADYADVWTRDYAPSFVINESSGKLKAVKWTYDAYSRKFPTLLKDNNVFKKLGPELGLELVEPGIVLEGGAIEVNGRGVLMTTEQCLLNSGRNPGFSKEQYEKYFADYLGISKVIWLPKGIAGDDHTDGHIDAVARFVAADTILCVSEGDAYEKLQKATDQNGEPFKVIKLIMPHVNYDDGKAAPASYANFYIGNEVVLVPSFNDPNDAQALKIIQSCFPERKAMPIDCRDLIYGGGGIHCITREQPML